VTVKRVFKTFYGVLAGAARWLVSEGVTHVAMEATGACSMPVCHALIEHGEFDQVLVCTAGHVKNVPGRKTGLADAEWLAQLLECGLLAGSFIPPAEVKAARDVVRYRAKIAQERVSEIARLGGSAIGGSAFGVLSADQCRGVHRLHAPRDPCFLAAIATRL
jgi:hypothetical protein